MGRKAVTGIMLTLLLIGALGLVFDVGLVGASGTIYIRANGSIEGTDRITTSNNITYTFTGNISDFIYVEKSNISVDGAGFTLQGTPSGQGFTLSGISNVTIQNTIIKGFTYGILCSSCNNITIYGNNITNTIASIYLYSSSSNTISGNNITNNDYGILLVSSNNSRILVNNITSNNYGIFLGSSNNNSILENDITANSWYAIQLQLASSNNKVYHNNFVDNANQVFLTPDTSANVWDVGYPWGGNYWSDYIGVDEKSGIYQNETGSDIYSIGDTPYVIDENNQDGYPLIYPRGSPAGAPGYYETSEYLIGSVAVGVVFLESNGTIDTQTENWNWTEVANVISEIQDGLSRLADQSPPGANVNFTIVDYNVSTSYEPISRNITDEGLWISEAMTYLGYPGTFYREQVRDYINALRSNLTTDWSFAIFVVDSSNDSDGYFPDWTRPAYSSLGGPNLVLTSANKGYGPGNLDWVAAHEIGHIFYATDEYDSKIEYSGYLNAPDQYYTNSCLMGQPEEWFWNGSEWVLLLPWSICENTRQQLGWRDSDGKQDIVDTFPDTVLNPYSPDPTSNPTLTYTGTVTEIPYPNNNPYPWGPGRGTGRDVTINKITKVEFRVDGGSWINATADDGAFDESEESFSFTTPRLSVGTHTIEARGNNSVGNAETSYARDEVTVTAPVGGIWVPVDKFSLLAPYIALVSTIILAISASVAYIKYRKKQ